MDPSKYLINGKGMAKRYSVSTQTISNWKFRFPDFPEPVSLPMVFGIPLWDVREVDTWWATYRPYHKR